MQHHSSDRRNLMTQYCFDNCSDTEFIISHFINWLDCSSGCSVCLSFSLASCTVAFNSRRDHYYARKNSVMRQPVPLYFLSVALFGRTSEGRGERLRGIKCAAIWPEEEKGACVYSPLSRFPFTLWVCFKCVLQTLFA